MFKTESRRPCKTDKGRRERLVLLAALLLCTLSVFYLLYSELVFGISSRHIKLKKQREFVYIDTNPDLSIAENEDASYEIEQDASTAVNKDASYEMKQDANTVVNKDVSSEIKQDTSTIVNKDVSSEIYRDTSTIDSMDMFDAVKKDDRNQSLQYLLTRLIGGENRTKLDSTGFACDVNSWSTAWTCVINKPVVIDTSTMQVHLQRSPDTENTTTIIRPYALYANEYTTQVTITTTKPTRPTCDHNHQDPAVIFSTGGFIGNLYHEFDETIIPLFITTRLFKSRVHFLVVDHNPTFFHKYRRVFPRLSDHEVINTANDSSVHCFPGAVIGLKFHYFLRINTSEPPQNYYSMLDFREFIRQTYNLKTKSVSDTQNPPKLLLISRERSRKFLNQEEMVKMMEELGFEVIIASSAEEMSNIEKFSHVVNSCSVMVGTHGAGMTNEIFLPYGAVMIQVRLLGFLWGVELAFSQPAPDMGLKFLEYKMKPEESSLVDEYGLDHQVLQNTSSVTDKGWIDASAMYMEKQNLRLDINRFRETLIEALRLIGRYKDFSNNTR